MTKENFMLKLWKASLIILKPFSNSHHRNIYYHLFKCILKLYSKIVPFRFFMDNFKTIFEEYPINHIDHTDNLKIVYKEAKSDDMTGKFDKRTIKEFSYNILNKLLAHLHVDMDYYKIYIRYGCVDLARYLRLDNGIYKSFNSAEDRYTITDAYTKIDKYLKARFVDEIIKLLIQDLEFQIDNEYNGE